MPTRSFTKQLLFLITSVITYILRQYPTRMPCQACSGHGMACVTINAFHGRLSSFQLHLHRRHGKDLGFYSPIKAGLSLGNLVKQPGVQVITSYGPQTATPAYSAGVDLNLIINLVGFCSFVVRNPYRIL
jgi:hypothetical protein